MVLKSRNPRGATPHGAGGGGVPQAAEVIGNRRSRVYHKPACRGAAGMSEKNRVTFPSEADAEKAGYSEGEGLLVRFRLSGANILPAFGVSSVCGVTNGLRARRR